ncbi:MAG: TolB family protein [Promethearchaeota archaeon]|jgi:Tol biopolymer transport system component
MKAFYVKHFSVLALLLVLPFISCEPTSQYDPHRFGIFISTLDGKNIQRIASDPYREMNHARVSRDKKLITFTRYNSKGRDGFARELNSSYDQSEIMVMRMDGSELRNLTSPRKGKVAFNSYWAPNGKSFIYVHNDNAKSKPNIYRFNITSKRITRVPTPQGLEVADPHQVGNKIVFPVTHHTKGNRFHGDIWIMNADGSQAKKLTEPKIGKNFTPPFGDFDPKLSPDGSKVAVMRHLDGPNWHIIVVDVKTGKERNLSKSVATDAVPEWSSDGKLLIFWHVDLKNLKNSGLYTMRPDGSNRKRIPLPRGYFYTMPAFFPGEGSGSNAHIIFSAEKNPRL